MCRLTRCPMLLLIASLLVTPSVVPTASAPLPDPGQEIRGEVFVGGYFYDLPAGVHRVRVARPGYASAEIVVTTFDTWSDSVAVSLVPEE